MQIDAYTKMMSPIWFKRQHKRKEKLDVPEYDIESQSVTGQGQSRLIILKYFARLNIQMRHTDPRT